MNTNLEIELIDKGKFKILKLKGRIDANWSLRLSESINQVIRSGAYDIVLDAADVEYISSAGVRVLLMSYKELAKLNGSFSLFRPGENVKSIINMMGLSALFDCSKFDSEMSGRTAGETDKSGFNESVRVAPDYGTINGIDIDVLFKSDYSARVKISGDIDKINGFSYSKEDIRHIVTGPNTISFGLGALGPGGQASLERAGEFISIGGFAAYMPSDGSKTPDYLIAGSDFTPEINYLYSAVCECDYSAAFNFKSAEAGSPVKLSDIVKTAHSVMGSDNILAVIIGEVEGVVGVSLALPPVADEKKSGAEGGPFGFPQIRDNFNITTEAAYDGHIAVCAGVSCSKHVSDPAPARFLRPLAAGSISSGHFHAAVFEFTPLKKNCRNPAELIVALNEKGSPEAVLHLINDWRDINGAGETEFISGACWIVNISGYESDSVSGAAPAVDGDKKEDK